MISASHNPSRDNGIKLFAPGGRKLPDDVEERIEAELRALLGQSPCRPVRRRRGHGSDGGRRRCRGLRRAPRRRASTVAASPGCGWCSTAPTVPRTGCAPLTFERLGADVTVIHAEPDGHEHQRPLRRHAPGRPPGGGACAQGADLGLAFDGDADRLIAVDHTGAVVDGDHIIAICALDLRARGRLRDDTVVVTVMTNLGFRLAMERAGINVVETAVGDRYVLEALAAGGYSLGGEQSGHVIFSDLATTGDGLLTGLRAARHRRCARAGPSPSWPPRP